MQHSSGKLTLFVIGLILLLSQCKKDPDTQPVIPHPSPDSIDTLKAKLSDMGFFYGDLDELNPTDNVIPYDLITPLFSDYAGKARFIYFPKGMKATYNATGVLNFPNGTFIVKTFYFDNDLRDPSLGRKLLETRILMKKNGLWTVGTYLWKADQTDADLNELEEGIEVPVSWIDKNGASQSTDYYIPSKLDCQGCHVNNSINNPIGPKARNINRDFDYASGTMNQLEKLKAARFLTGLPAINTVPKVAKFDDPTDGTLELRSRAYLDVNCGHCHNPDGQASGSGLMLYYTAPRLQIGICKEADRTVGSGLKYDIVPGKQDSSLIVFRMEAVSTTAKMPTIGRSIIHQEGLDLIKEWINSLADPACH